MRDQLLDVLRHTWYPGFVEFLNIYHIKTHLLEVVPDLHAVITEVDPTTNSFVTTPTNAPWLWDLWNLVYDKGGIPVKFTRILDGSTSALTEATIEEGKTYYINTARNVYNCTKFTVSDTPGAGETVPLPFSNFAFTMTHERSYLIVEDNSIFDINQKIVLEDAPQSFQLLEYNDNLNSGTKYYVHSIHTTNGRQAIRIKANQSDNEYMHFIETFFTKSNVFIDNTFIEAISYDKKLQIFAQTDEKINNLYGTFGVDNLDKFWETLLNTEEYPNDPILFYDYNAIRNNVTSRDNVSFKWYNQTTTFHDNFRFIDNEDVVKYHPYKIIGDSHWNITFVPQQEKITQFLKMARTYDEYQFFDLWTRNLGNINPNLPRMDYHELRFDFGDDTAKYTKFGELVFHSNLSGTYTPKVMKNYSTVAWPIAAYSGLIQGINLPQRFVCRIVDAYNGKFDIDDASQLQENMPIQFENPPDSAQSLGHLHLQDDRDYYVYQILDCNTFTISDTPNGSKITFRHLEDIEYDFWLIKNAHALIMENAVYTERIGNELLLHIEPNMKVLFFNPDDSSDLMSQTGLEYRKEYYVKEVLSSNNVVRDKVTKYAVQLNETTGDPTQDITNPHARFPDKTNYPTGDVEAQTQTRFTISEFPNSTTIELPFGNFFFYVAHELNEIEVPDTDFFALHENMPVVFTDWDVAGAVLEANLDVNKTYYVVNIVSKTRLQISETPNGPVKYLGTTINRVRMWHATGNGLIFSSYAAIPNPTPAGTQPKFYNRLNPHRYDDPNITKNDAAINRYSVPNDKYKFQVEDRDIQLMNKPFLGPYYSNFLDYMYGKGNW